MKKIIITAVIVMLVIATSVAVLIDVNERRAESGRLYDLSEKYLTLSVKRDGLIAERGEYVKARDAETRRGNYVVLFFDNVSDNLMDKAYPLLSKHGYRGTIVLCDGLVPGEAGNISREDFDFLLSQGWDTAIGYSSEIDMGSKDAPQIFEEYLDDYLARLEAAGIEIPITYCFEQDTYNKKFEPALKEHGFKIIRHFGETGDSFGSAYIEGEFYYIGAGVCCAASSKLQENVDIAYEQDLTYSMSVRYIGDYDIDTKKDCTTSKYQRMLSYINTNSSGTVVCTVSELYDYKQEQHNSAIGIIGDYNKKIAEYDVKIAALDEELALIVEELE